MAGEHDAPEEELELGPRTQWRISALPRFGWRWRAGIAVVVAAAIAIPLIVTSHPPPRSIAQPSSPSAPVGARPPATSHKPTVRRTRPFVLGIHRRWELFGRGPRSVVRIQFARGRITTTPVPPLASTGPVFFVIGRHAAVVRPLDSVPGYVVPDGRRAAAPPAPFDCGGPALPGLWPDTAWVVPCTGRSRRFTLVQFDGGGLGLSVHVPRGFSPIAAVPDGAGSLLFPGTASGRRATFDVQPHRTSVITDQVLAVGPTRWLVRWCPRKGRCRGDAVLDPSNGNHRRLLIRFADDEELGVISPDGSSAALPTPAPGAAIVYVDLATGAFRGLLLHPNSAEAQTMVWSPDSRWLFILGRHGTLYAVDGRTGLVVTDLTATLHLPRLDQLAVRPAPPTG